MRSSARPSPLSDPVLASRAFGAYLAVSGAGFLLAPRVLLPLLGLPAPLDGWIRIVGLLVAILGMYFIYCATPDERRFFRATVIARVMFFSGVVLLVLLELAPPLLVLFGLVDLAGAGWTVVALRRSAT